MERDELTKNWQITSVLSRVEAKVVPVPGSHLHSRTPLKPLSTLKYYSDLFESSCRITVADTLKNHGDQDNQRHQGNTTQNFTDKLLADFLPTHLRNIPILFILIKLCKLLHICDTSDNVYI